MICRPLNICLFMHRRFAQSVITSQFLGSKSWHPFLRCRGFFFIKAVSNSIFHGNYYSRSIWSNSFIFEVSSLISSVSTAKPSRMFFYFITQFTKPSLVALCFVHVWEEHTPSSHKRVLFDLDISTVTRKLFCSVCFKNKPNSFQSFNQNIHSQT